MSRIDECFARLRGHRTVLIPYLAGGDPDPETTVSLMHALVAAGADLIELGIPFSDPMADGPVIQAACDRALAQGTDLDTIFELTARFRGRDETTPVVLMGYMNPIERYRPERFLERAHEAGVDGLLIVDLPPEEAADFNQAARARGLDQIFLVSPTTTERRIRMICGLASGFVYYVALKGITGASHLVAADVGSALDRIRVHTALPVGVGFGIKTPADAAEVAGRADAVVVGSALIERIAEAGPQQAAAAAGEFLEPIRDALRQAATRQGRAAVQ